MEYASRTEKRKKDRLNRKGSTKMKKMIAFALYLVLLAALGTTAWAETPGQRKNAVSELWSADGTYTDDVDNVYTYSYHVPQLNADTPAAQEINGEIAERFGRSAEDLMKNMEGGFSLWCWQIQWHAYWYGSKLFLLVEENDNGDFRDYAAYGYDFEKACRVTKEMILEEFNITPEDYEKQLREKVKLIFEDLYDDHPNRELLDYDKMLEGTMKWLDDDPPMFIDGAGQIEAIVKIVTIAGAGWYYHLVTPFAYG